MTKLCACMGPQNGSPFCPCSMINHGLATEESYAWSDAKKEEFMRALDLYEPDGE